MPTATATKSAGPKPGPQMLDLTALTKKPTKGKATAYPKLPHDDEVAELVRTIATDQALFDSLKGSLEINKAELASRVAPFYFENAYGKAAAPESSVSCIAPAVAATDETDALPEVEALTCFQKRTKKTTDPGNLPALMTVEREGGEGPVDYYSEYIRQAYVLKIDGDEIPVENAPALLVDLQEVLAKHSASAALTAEAVLKPTEEFWTKRHTIFTPEENLAINLEMPIVVQVKTKGRGNRS